MYDPQTQQMTMIDTCFGTHHLEFGFDNEHTLFFSNPAGSEIGWINTALYDKTQNAEASQGWCPAVLDTNGDGRITEWVEPDEPLDPTKDKRIAGRSCGFNVNLSTTASGRRQAGPTSERSSGGNAETTRPGPAKRKSSSRLWTVRSPGHEVWTSIPTVWRGLPL